MTFLIRESTSRSEQVYAVSLYSNGVVRHSAIYRDGSDLMFMALTFTSLMELVHFYSRKPIHDNKPLQKAAITYQEFMDRRRNYGTQGNNAFKPLETTIELKIKTLRAGQ